MQEFMEVLGDIPRWVPFTNVVFHFPESDPAIIGKILEAISQKK